MEIVRRGKTLHLRKRVPGRYTAVEDRKVVWVALRTDSETVARQKAPVLWQEMLDGWEAKLAGATGDAEARFHAAQNIARMRGFRYLPALQTLALPIGELVARSQAIKSSSDTVEAAALLGTVGDAPITVSRALELFWSLTKDEIRGKTDDQVRRWKNPRIKATRNFIAVVGDKALKDIAPDDMLAFRDWWIDRLDSESLTPNSANKDLTHLGRTWRIVNRMKRLNLVLPLSDLSIKEGEQKTRLPFSTAWIRERLIKGLGAVDSSDSRFAWSVIQGCLWGGGNGRFGSACVERRGLGADRSFDHRSS